MKLITDFINKLPPDPRTRTFLGLMNGSLFLTKLLLIVPMAALMYSRAERLSALPWLRTIYNKSERNKKYFLDSYQEGFGRVANRKA